MKAKAAATIPAGKFKTHCLTLMKKVQATGEPLVITNRGKPWEAHDGILPD
jgi:PHD/YefM family antitoxin component YafN of YafNO toxin-antitoxin module